MKTLVYIAAQGNIVASFKSWCANESMGEQLAVTYSEGIFDLCRTHGLRGFFFVPNPRKAMATDGTHSAYEIGRVTKGRGLGFYLSWAMTTLSLLRQIIRIRPDYIILTDAIVHPLPFAIARLWGGKIVLAKHVRPWNPFLRTGPNPRPNVPLEGWFLRNVAAGVVAVSGSVIAQMRQLAGPHCPPAIAFSPRWLKERFDHIPLPPADREPFRLLFLGRIEESKGVFDLLRIARCLIDEGLEVRVDFCGHGSAFDALCAMRENMNLGDAIGIHGHCGYNDVQRWISQCHVIMAPTRTNFSEGLNKVVVEAVLARRPVISSRVCPAIELIGDAGIEVEPDDWRGYADAVRRLIVDEGYYNKKVEATARERLNVGWGLPSFPEAIEMVFGLADARPAMAPSTVKIQSDPQKSAGLPQ